MSWRTTALDAAAMELEETGDVDRPPWSVGCARTWPSRGFLPKPLRSSLSASWRR